MSNEEFWIWVERELHKRDLSFHRIERDAGLSNAAISKLARNRTAPTPTACKAIARAFGMTDEEVFRLAGILSPVLPAVAEEREAIRILRSLPEGVRVIAIRILRSLQGPQPSLEGAAGKIEHKVDQTIIDSLQDLSPEEKEETLRFIKDRVSARSSQESSADVSSAKR